MQSYWPAFLLCYGVILVLAWAFHGGAAALTVAIVAILAFKGGEIITEHRHASSPPGSPESPSDV